MPIFLANTEFPPVRIAQTTIFQAILTDPVELDPGGAILPAVPER